MSVDAENRMNKGPHTWKARGSYGLAEQRDAEIRPELLEPCSPSQHMTGRAETTTRRWRVVAVVLTVVTCSPATPTSATQAFSADLKEALKTSKYVYVASNRKDGSFGTPAEIWFMYYRGAVWVASPPTTWRVRRIRAGRPKVRIAVG